MNAIGPHEVNGLPAHILLVHFTIVVLPTAAAATVVSAAWPAARRRLGIVTPLIALIGLICVPISVSAGNWLFARVHHTPLILRHQKLAHGLLPWAIALFVVAVIEYAWFYLATPRPTADRAGRGGSHGMLVGGSIAFLFSALAIRAVGRSAGTVVEVYRIGESGSRAVWEHSFSKTPL